jgi:protein-S-isoprenylcysteine O-methyltransferase Ste14
MEVTLSLSQVRWKRLIWTAFVTFYFIDFTKNLFNDALPGRSLVPILFFISFTVWMAFEYYFGSPFFQSGAVEPAPLWKSLFALFYYPFLGYAVADYTWTRWTQLGVLSPYLNVLGIVLFLLGAAIRLSSLYAVLRSRSGKLVRRGLFNRVRQPRYLGTLVQMIAVPLVFSSWLGLLLALAVGLPLILRQIRTEEASLLSVFKEEFASYQQRVPVLIPRRKKPRMNADERRFDI